MDPSSERGPDCRIAPADADDATGIAAVHVAVWRSAYAGILPDRVLLRLSVPRLAAQYAAAIERGGHALVATAPEGRVVGFTTFAPGMPPLPGVAGTRWGEVETLYVHDDWRDQGIGRSLLARAAFALRRMGCGAVFLNVLADNNSRWFYGHLGGRPQTASVTYVGGRAMNQIAMVWDPVDPLADLA